MAQQKLEDLLHKEFQKEHIAITIAHGELTLACCDLSELRTVLFTLRDVRAVGFNQVIDVCAVDYLHYGQ